ncbi:MAG: histidine kinase [Frankiales bacterium]|nr:histidine kinase [Frankiales bacterium]
MLKGGRTGPLTDTLYGVTSPLPPRGLPVRRQVLGAAVAAVGLPVITAALVRVRDDLSLATPVLVVLLLVVGVALVGGLRPAVPAALGGGLALN